MSLNPLRLGLVFMREKLCNIVQAGFNQDWSVTLIIGPNFLFQISSGFHGRKVLFMRGKRE